MPAARLALLAAGAAAEKWQSPNWRYRPVCVTGATGYIGSVVATTLRDAGYTVIGTTRDPKRWRDDAALAGIEMRKADVRDPDSLRSALATCGSVLHTASPFWMHTNGDPEEVFVRPAVDGTLNVLRAAAAAGARRIVVTSSAAAVTPQHLPTPGDRRAGSGEEHSHEKVYGEADWNNDSTLTDGPYRLSKTLAERAAWRWLEEEAPAGTHFATLCPAFVLGPPTMKRADGESVRFMQRLLEGEYSNGIPRRAFGIYDVRDLALAHMRALERDEAHHRRFVLSSPEGVGWLKIADIVRDRCGQVVESSGAAATIPTQYEGDTNVPTRHPTGALYDADPAEDILGITPRLHHDMICDMAVVMLRLGIAEHPEAPVPDPHGAELPSPDLSGRAVRHPVHGWMLHHETDPTQHIRNSREGFRTPEQHEREVVNRPSTWGHDGKAKGPPLRKPDEFLEL